MEREPGEAAQSGLDYTTFIRKLRLPPGFVAPTRLAYEDLLATVGPADLEVVDGAPIKGDGGDLCSLRHRMADNELLQRHVQVYRGPVGAATGRS